MPRIVKHPEVRRNELLDCASRLFLERGYDATTVNDVIACAAISKGAFYHHFASKEALLEALAQRHAEESLVAAKDILCDPTLNAYERLTSYLAHSRGQKMKTAPIAWATFAPIFRPENLALYYRLHMAVRAVVAPAIAKIIAEGVAEQCFDTPDPASTAELLLMLGASSYDAVQQIVTARTELELERGVAALDKRLDMLGIAADRLLGIPDGSIRFAEPGYSQLVVAARRSALG
jgi:AcrR family transcriptional regulator